MVDFVFDLEVFLKENAPRFFQLETSAQDNSRISLAALLPFYHPPLNWLSLGIFSGMTIYTSPCTDFISRGFDPRYSEESILN
jgi:hypothetical protein